MNGASVSRHEHRLHYGATLLGDGRARFRIWAPSQPALQLEIDGRAPLPMQRQEDGCFELTVACAAGARYRFRLDDGLAVPDPAARAQADDVHGYSLLTDPQTYAWRQTAWRGRPWHETVLYELHVGACGGFDGVRARLPALAALGITAVELMPLNEFPGRHNWGYDSVLPYAPDRAYGEPDALKRLIDEAHRLGLMIFVDVVYNHFGPDGNYLHAYAPTFFRDDITTPWGAAIDFRRPEVRRYFIDNALYWLHEFRVDGLRFDAVHAITDEDFLDELALKLRDSIEPGRHVHLVLENEHNDARLLDGGERGADGARYDAQWNDDGHNALHVLLTGEHEGYYAAYADTPAQHLARVLGEGFCYQGEPMPTLHGRPRGTPSAALPPTAFVLFQQNHDQVGNRAFGERLSLLADADALRVSTMMVLLSPQIPLLFFGEEWGSRAPFLFFTDHGAQLAQLVRDGRRKEFAKFAAFSDPARRAQIPDPNDPQTFQRSIPDDEHGPAAEAMRAYYRQLLTLRRTQLMPRLRGARALEAAAVGSHALRARWQLGDGATLTMALNFGAEAQALPGAALPAQRLLFETQAGVAASAQQGRLPAGAGCVWLDPPGARASGTP